MKATLITVTKPERALYLSACINTFRMHCEHTIEWVLITERENARAIQDRQPSARVVDMESLPGWRACEVGYVRQMQAKMLSYNATDADLLLFTDDDVIAQAKWSAGMFKELDRPVIYFSRSPGAWTWGSVELFGHLATKNYQLALPFAYSRDALQYLVNSRVGQRILASYAKGQALYSEFQSMGEFARQNQLAKLRNIDTERTHWTLNRGIFADYQGKLKELDFRMTLPT